MISFLVLAAAFSANITLSEKKDPLEVTLHVQHPENTTLDTEGLGKSLTTNLFYGKPPFELVKQDLNTFTLKPLVEGRHPITFYEISFTSKEGAKTTIASPLVFVDIPSKTTKSHMREIRGAVLIALPILYIGLSSLMLISFYTPPPLTEEEIRQRSKQLALKTLDQLSQETPSKSLVKSLARITKEFFNIPNTKTTEEILSLNQDETLTKVLKTSDLVTFADRELTPDEKQELIKRVKLNITSLLP